MEKQKVVIVVGSGMGGLMLLVLLLGVLLAEVGVAFILGGVTEALAAAAAVGQVVAVEVVMVLSSLNTCQHKRVI
jgi:hypothetical protein